MTGVQDHREPPAWIGTARPLVPKPDWFDDLVADVRLASREVWFTPNGFRRADLGASDPVRHHQPDPGGPDTWPATPTPKETL